MSHELQNEPILDTELPPELRGTFRELIDEAYTFSTINGSTKQYEYLNDERDAAWLLHDRIKKQVSAHPILARTISTEMGMRSLLALLCERSTYGKHRLETMQFLLEKNPQALFWRDDNSNDNRRAPIHWIGELPWNCDLLPWIAEHYPWVLQHPMCQEKPPHLVMMESYADIPWHRQYCNPQTVRRFYEQYPQGLREKIKEGTTSIYPISLSLNGFDELDPDLFIWMAEQYPEPLYDTPVLEGNLLHKACTLLARREKEYGNWDQSRRPYFQSTSNLANIIRFLASEHAGLARQQARHLTPIQQASGGYLPIHELSRVCNMPIVQEMAIVLLQAHPECIQVKAGTLHPELSKVPFLQQVHPLILEELEVNQEISMLTQVSQNLLKASILSTTQTSTSAPNDSAVISSLLGPFSEVFHSWANLRVSSVLSAQKQKIHECIAETCRLRQVDGFL